MNFIARILITALALVLTAYILPGVTVSGLYPALIAAVVLGVLNLFIKPILLIITLPINVITLGLFTLVINGLLFWFAASFLDGFAVDGFVTAIIGAAIVSVVSAVANWFID